MWACAYFTDETATDYSVETIFVINHLFIITLCCCAFIINFLLCLRVFFKRFRSILLYLCQFQFSYLILFWVFVFSPLIWTSELQSRFTAASCSGRDSRPVTLPPKTYSINQLLLTLQELCRSCSGSNINKWAPYRHSQFTFFSEIIRNLQQESTKTDQVDAEHRGHGDILKTVKFFDPNFRNHWLQPGHFSRKLFLSWKCDLMWNWIMTLCSGHWLSSDGGD